jgi:VWFA-related protein
MVVLTFRVNDGKGRSVTGLKSSDFRIFENEIPQKIASFAKGSEPLLQFQSSRNGAAGTSIFILFDTSNRMYGMFPYVYDAIAEFVRRLNPADSVAIYTFSRNLSRAATLTNDHERARAGLQNAVAGDDTAVFNSLLLTLRDAARVPGRKAVVLFSNGPDNASMVSPEDVGRVAENEGIPVYIISTQDAANDRPSAEAFQSLTTRTGGKLYRARRWQDQAGAFASVREDILGSYTVCYYPVPNTDPGFRRIQVEIAAPRAKSWRIHARAGYEPQQDRAAVVSNPKK